MIAFLFPGQGSQSVGMGKAFYDAFSEAKEVFQEVDDALGESLSELIFSGDASELSLTRNTQPALMSVSLAAFRCLQKQANFDVNGQMYAGHSLGEYSAHAAIETFSLRDTAKLLRTRGDAMQESVPVGVGAMAALIGAGGLEKAEALCMEVSEPKAFCSVANDNAAEQIVVSGHKAAIDLLISKAGEYGFRRALPLPVSAPFHCQLMHTAADVMSSALEVVSVPDKLNAKLIANVSCEFVETGEHAKELLVQQVTGRVRWRETMEKLYADGVRTFVEVGAGKVLAGMARRALSDAKVYNLEQPQDLEVVISEALGC